ncbi:MAG: hypothetical protein B7Z26_08540 [Asticcacaulis sp. 32-58-5]|nr:MAG: hypothetical protein B7Z26_08540 [Asticcacaulis sp. 32-58-5]
MSQYAHQDASAPIAKSRPSLKVCGDCNMCCKVYDIDDLGKKAGDLCHHTGHVKGCGVWGLHPKTCQDFKCLWLKHEDLNALWRPDIAGFVLRLDPNGTTLNIDVDHGRANAWRAEPYYSQIKLWSEVFPTQGLVLIHSKDGLWVVTPTEDLNIPNPKGGDTLETGMEDSLFGPRPFVRVIPQKKTPARRRA